MAQEANIVAVGDYSARDADGGGEVGYNPTLRTAPPILKYLSTSDGLLSTLINDPLLLKTYRARANLEGHLFKLMYWKMVQVKFEEDFIEGDDHRLTLTDLGKVMLRTNGD